MYVVWIIFTNRILLASNTTLFIGVVVRGVLLASNCKYTVLLKEQLSAHASRVNQRCE